MIKLFLKLKRRVIKHFNRFKQNRKLKRRNLNKVFVIGRNKTGTTSINKAFKDLGFIVGDQREAEKLQKYYLEANFYPIIKYCKSAEVFQDFPFSYPDTYKYMDESFPNSKFILTVRETPEQWYNSITKFHSKMFGKGSIPTKKDLEDATYVEKGWIWKNFSFIYKPIENDIYNEERLVKTYIDYNNEIIDYFKDRSIDFLILNLNDEDAYQKFINFIGIKSTFKDFPWKNKTSKIETRK